MINLILMTVLVILLLFNSLIFFYLIQRLMLLKGDTKPQENIKQEDNSQEEVNSQITDNPLKKKPGRKLGSKNKSKELSPNGSENKEGGTQ